VERGKRGRGKGEGGEGKGEGKGGGGGRGEGEDTMYSKPTITCTKTQCSLTQYMSMACIPVTNWLTYYWQIQVRGAQQQLTRDGLDHR